MSKLQIGDEVRILPERRHRHVPESGYVGHVTKVGRQYATATYTTTSVAFGEERQYEHTIEFDMDTGNERGGNYYGDRVLTPEQVAAEERRAAALAVLKEAGFEVRAGGRPSGELAEALAAVVKTFAPKGE